MVIQAAAAAAVETHRIGSYTHWKHTAYINIRMYIIPELVYTYTWRFFYLLSALTRSLSPNICVCVRLRIYTEVVYYKRVVCACSIHTFFIPFSVSFFLVVVLFRSLSISLTPTAYIPHFLSYAAIHSVHFTHTHSIRPFSISLSPILPSFLYIELWVLHRFAYCVNAKLQ